MKLQIETTCPTQWKFEYESDDPQLDELYERAKTDQWNSSVDIDWDKGIREGSDVFKREETPLAQTKFFKSLSKQTQSDLLANQAAFMLSQFLHGEQGALLCCGQLVDAVPSIEGKLYAATQVMDEARHVAFGILTLSEEIPKMPEDDRVALEDFGLAAIGILQGGSQPTGQAIIDAGIDPVEMRKAIAKEQEQATGIKTEQKSVIHEYMIPNMGKIGLISDRMRPKYIEAGLIREA